MKVTLTDRKIKSLKPAPAGQRYDLMDAVTPGFGVRVTDRGQRTFILIARYPSNPKNPTRRAVAEVGAITLEQAREEARRWQALIRTGVDPAVELERQREAEQEAKRVELRKNELLFENVAADFLRRHVSKTRNRREVERCFRMDFLPYLSGRLLTDITKRDIVATVERVVDRGAAAQARNVFGHIRRLYTWAIGRGLVEHSPCDHMHAVDLCGPKTHRQRILSDAELRALWEAAGETPYPYGSLFKLLLLSGQRKSDWANASWSEINFEKRVLVIPPERFKSNCAHAVPLTPEIVEILEALPRFKSGDHLFSLNFGVSPINGFAQAKRRLDRLMIAKVGTVDNYVIHDIRRTVRTHLSMLPIPDVVKELIIGHTQTGLHKVYDQYGYLDEKRRGLELWTARLRSIAEPSPADNVVSIKARV